MPRWLPDGRARRQFVTESLVLASLSAAVGLRPPVSVSSVWCVWLLAPSRALRRPTWTAASSGMPSWDQSRRSCSLDSPQASRFGGRSLSRPSEMGPGRPPQAQAVCACDDLLVAAQLALAVVLLIGGGLMVKSFMRMNAHPEEFRPEIDFAGQGSPSGPDYEEAQARHSYADELLRRVQAIPGVQAAGVMPNYPIRTGLDVRGRQRPPNAGIPISTTLNATSAGYASAMGLRVVRGRWIGQSEPTPVVVINESLARREFGDGDPIGMQLSVQAIAPNPKFPALLSADCRVVSDVKQSKLDSPAEPEVYIPHAHVPIGAGIALVVRTPRDPLALVPTLRSVMAELDPAQPLYDVQTFEDALASSVAPRRFTAFVLNAFALTALVLAVVGIYGVMSCSSRATWTRDRIAHGTRCPASGSRWHGGRTRYALGLIGIAIGVGTAAGLTRLLAFLYDVEPLDPQTFGPVAILQPAQPHSSPAPCQRPAPRCSSIP